MADMNVKIGYTIDKTGLNELKKELTSLYVRAEKEKILGTLKSDLAEAANAASKLEDILNGAWNSKMNQLDLSKVNTGIKATWKSAQELKMSLEKGGAAGASAYNNFAISVLNTNVQLKKTSETLDRMATTFKNTVRYGISSSIFNNFTNSIQKAFDYTKQLDTSLNDIRIVTGQSADEMNKFAVRANRVAKDLGRSTKDFTEASLIYYQQGLGNEEAQARAEVTLKAANVTGQSGQEVSEQLTAVWNGYKVTADEAELYVDKLAAVAATTASDLEELSTGMSKVASAANLMGVDVDQLNAQLATIVSVTRQAPESVGTALKTIYARMGDIEAGLDTETDLGIYTKKMAEMGVNVLDANNNLRDMGDVIEEIGSKWQSMSREQQIALSQTMAGTRQYNNLLSLFDNWDMYTEALETSANAAGTLQEQQDIFMESTEAHLQKISTEAERTYDVLFDQDTVNGFADALTGVLSIFNDFLESIGGGTQDFIFFGSTIANIFNKQIGGAIERQIENIEAMKANTGRAELQKQFIGAQSSDSGVNKEVLDKVIPYAEKHLDLQKYLTKEENEQWVIGQKQIAILEERIQGIDHYVELAKKFNVDENDSIEKTQEKLENQAESFAKQLESLNKAKEDLELYNRNASKEGQFAVDEKIKEAVLSRIEGLKEEEQIRNKINADMILSETEVNAILDAQNQKRSDTLGLINEIKVILQAINDKENNKYADLVIQLEQFAAGLDSIETKAERQKGISILTQSFTALISIGTALSGMFKTLGDESLTSGEKIKRVLTVLVGLTPLLLFNIKAFTQALPALAMQLGATNISLKSTAAAAWQAEVSVMGLQMSLGAFIGVAALVGAAIAGVIVVASTLADIYNKDAIAADRANEAAKELKKANEEVNQSYQELENTWGAYQTAKDKLDSLTEGTQEWKDALKETNDAALELLNNLDNLSGDEIRELYERDSSTGELKIKEDAMQAVMDKERQRVMASNLATAAGQAYATRMQANSDLLESTRINNQVDHPIARLLSGPIDDAFNDIPIWMREINAQLDKDNIIKHLDEFKDGLTNNEFKEKMDELGISLDNLSKDELEEFKSSIEKMAKSTDAANEKLKAMAQIQVDEALGDKYDETVKKIATDQLTNRTQELTKEYLDNFNKNFSKISDSSDRDYQNLVKELQAAGLDYSATQGQKAVKGSDTNRSFTFLDENGELVERNAEWVAQTLAASKAMEELSGNASKVSKALSNLDVNLGNKSGFSEGIKNFITTGNFENMDQVDFNLLKNAMGEDISGFLTKNMGVSEKDLKSMLGEDYKNNIKEALENYSIAFDKYIENFSKSVKQEINEIDGLSTLSVTQQKQIAKNLQSARNANYLDDSLMKDILEMYKGVDSTHLEEFSKVISGIEDWSGIDVETLSETLQKVGIETNFSNDQLQNFINNMREVADASKSFDELSQQYGEIHKIIDNLKVGDTISADDYSKLGSAAEGYFTRMLDGTYKLTKSAIEFYDTVEKKQREEFQIALKNERKNYEVLKKVVDYDVKELKENQRQITTTQTEAKAKETYTPMPTSTTSTNLFQSKIGATLPNSFYQSEYEKRKVETPEITSVETNWEKVEKQLETIQALDSSNNKLGDWFDGLKEHSLSDQDLENITKRVNELATSEDVLKDSLERTSASLFDQELAILSSADSLKELKEIAAESDIDKSSRAYQTAEVNLHEEEKWEDLDNQEVKDYAEHLQEVATSSDDLADSLKDDKEASEELSRQISRMNTGVETLADNWEDWSDVLAHSSESSEEYAKALQGTKKALADILDTSEDYISKDFVKDHMNEISAAAKGNAEAIDDLNKALAKDLVYRISIENGLSEADVNDLVNRIQNLQNTIPDIEVGTRLDMEHLSQDEQKFVDEMNEIIAAAGMTADQANALFSTMGFQANIVTEPQPITKTGHSTITSSQLIGNETYSTIDKDGSVNVVSVPSYETFTKPGHEYIYTDYVDGIAMETSPDGSKVPKINSLVKKAPGSANNYSTRNAGGGSPGRSSGGGGGSAKQSKKQDAIKDQVDRYHKVNTQIQKVENSLKKLQSQQDKFVGKSLLDNLNKQWQELNTQVQNYNEKLRIAQGEQDELKSKLASQGVQFNADGTISNYTQAFQAQLNGVNNLINQYNSLSAEAQESWDENKILDNAKEDFNKFKEDMNRYDELVSNFIPDLQQNIQDAIDKQVDLQIEKFKMEIEIRLDLAEAERDWNEFKKKIIDEIDDDDILGNAMARLVDFSSYYKEDNTGIVQALQKQVDNTLAQLKQMDKTGWSDVYGDNRATALEDLKNYYDELTSNLEDVLDLQKEIHESYIDMMDEAQEKFDEQIDAYEMISDLIEHDMDVISLVYGEEAYGQLAKYYDKQQQNLNGQLDFQRQQMDFWRNQLDTLEEGSDEWENAKEKWMDAVGQWNDLVEESIENLQDKYLNAINLIFQNLNNKITDGLGLDYVEEEWNLINENADQYLDTVNSLYEVQKLENKYLEALDNTDSISAQRKLKEVMDEQLTDLREKDKLTEYDVERANRRYEIALKEIALQEAQQNKTKMRLRRDSQGNYRYEYTSDTDQLSQLQDELDDMYNSLYNFDKARYQENLDQMYSVWVEFQEKMAEAAQINDPVARSERELLLQNQYEQLINGLTEQNATVRENLHESAFDDLARLYDVDVSNFQNMSDQEKETLMGDLIPYWESGVQHMTEVFAGEGGFLGTCKDAFEQLHDATKDYEDSLDELEQTGRLDFESIGEGIDENIDRTQQLISDNNDLIYSYEQELAAIANVIGQLDGLIEKYNAAKDAAIAATKAAYEYWSEQQRQAAAAAAAANGGSASGSGSSSNRSSGSGSGSGGSGGGDGNLAVGDTATYTGSYYYDSYGSGPSGSKYSGVANGIVVDRVTGNPYGIHIHSADGRYRDLGWVKKSQLSGYDTGGYTGEWGNSGRLALLHQKELVLNKDDTENMLNAISIMRNLTNTLGSSILGRLATATAGRFDTNANNSILEQNVHIDAQFPNVKDSREIEEALNNLVNMASMRANKR